MSHFTVMVIGNNPKKQLEKFDESLRVVWVDEEEKYRVEYNTKKVKEFYCASHSSWGVELDKKYIDKLRRIETGGQIEIEFKDRMQYLEPGKKYRGYYLTKTRKRSKVDVWFEMVKIIRNDGNNTDVVFKGRALIRKIDPPKEILLKEKYPDYETYLREWHGVENIEKQGYWNNPDAKWDWYLLGGRWSGDVIKLKEGATGKIGESGAFGNKTGVDRAKYGDIENIKNIRTFAVVKDGVWYERGKMGWFGITTDEKDEDKWEKQIQELLKDCDNDTLISIYDCHI